MNNQAKYPQQIAEERVANAFVMARETMVGDILTLVRDEC